MGVFDDWETGRGGNRFVQGNLFEPGYDKAPIRNMGLMGKWRVERGGLGLDLNRTEGLPNGGVIYNNRGWSNRPVESARILNPLGRPFGDGDILRTGLDVRTRGASSIIVPGPTPNPNAAIQISRGGFAAGPPRTVAPTSFQTSVFGEQGNLFNSSPLGGLKGSVYSTPFTAPNRIYADGAFSDLSTRSLRGNILGSQGNLFSTNYGFEGDVSGSKYFNVRGRSYDNALRADSFERRARSVLGGLKYQNLNLGDAANGAFGSKFQKFANSRADFYGRMAWERTASGFQKFSSGPAFNLGLSSATVFSTLQGSQESVESTLLPSVISYTALKMTGKVAPALGKATFGGVLGMAQGLYQGGQLLGGDPLSARAAQGQLGGLAASSAAYIGIGSLLSATGVGAPVGVPLALLGAGFAGWGAQSALDARKYNAIEQRALAIRNAYQSEVNSGLALGSAGAAARFGTLNLDYSPNPFQKAATSVRAALDATFAGGPQLDFITDIFGGLGTQQVRGEYALLGKAFRGGSGPFQGLSIAQGAVELYRLQQRNIEGMGRLGSVVEREEPKAFERLLQDAERLAEDSTEGLTAKQGKYVLQEAQKLDLYQSTAQKAAFFRDNARANVKSIQEGIAAPVLPYKPSTLYPENRPRPAVRSAQSFPSGGNLTEIDIMTAVGRQPLPRNTVATLPRTGALRATTGQPFRTPARPRPATAPLDAQIIQGLGGIQQAGRQAYGNLINWVNQAGTALKGWTSGGTLATANRAARGYEADRGLAQGKYDTLSRNVGAAGRGGAVAAARQALAKGDPRALATAMIRGGGSGGGGGDWGARAAARDAQMQARFARMEYRALAGEDVRYRSEAARSRIDSLLDTPEYEPVGFNHAEYRSGVSYVPGATSMADFREQIGRAEAGQRSAAEEALGRNQALLASYRGRADDLKKQVPGLFAGANPAGDAKVGAQVRTAELSALNKIAELVAKQTDMVQRQTATFQRVFSPQEANNRLRQQYGEIYRPVMGALQQTGRYLDSQSRQLVRQSNLEAQYQLKNQKELGLISPGRFYQQDQRSRYLTAKTNYEDALDVSSQNREEVAEMRKLLDEKDANGNFVVDGEKRTALSARVGRVEAASKRQLSLAQTEWAENQKLYGKSATARGLRTIQQQSLQKTIAPYAEALLNAGYSGGSPAGGLAKAFRADLSDMYTSAFSRLGTDVLSGLSGGYTPTASGAQGVFETLAHIANKRTGTRPGVGPVDPRSWSSATMSQAFAGIGAGQIVGTPIYRKINPYYNAGAGQVGQLGLGLAGATLGRGHGKYGAALGGAVGSLIGGAAGLTGASPMAGAATGALSGALGGAQLGSMLMPGIGTAIGAVGGALLGGLSGWFGGKQSREAKRQAEAAERERQGQLKRQAIGLAQGSFGDGPAWASDIFSGYGNFDSNMAGLTNYLGSQRAGDVAREAGLSGKPLASFMKKWGQQVSKFDPVLNLARENRAVLERPGGIQGGLLDINLSESLRTAQAGPRSGGPLNQLTGTFQDIRSQLGQYGFDGKRAALATNLFQQTYQNLRTDLGDRMRQGDRDFGFLVEGQALQASGRRIQLDVMGRSVQNFERDSRRQMEAAMGTLQRRENRAAIVKDLKEEQSFNRDILNRQYANAQAGDSLQNKQDWAERSDFMRGLDDLQRSSIMLDSGFSDMLPKLTDASDEFYKLSELLKDVNRSLELLGRNLR